MKTHLNNIISPKFHKQLCGFFIWIFVLITCLQSNNIFAQANASINILSLNSGQLNLSGTGFIQVDVGNNGSSTSIGVNKVRAQLSIPPIAQASITADQTGLPAGWIILVNSGSSITVCNGTDIIPQDSVRRVFIKIRGVSLGGPSTVTGVLSFGPGTGVCTGPGSLPGDVTADNTSQTTITVVNGPTPVILSRFTGEIKNCTPVLNWNAASEINTAKYIIEKKANAENNWTVAGEVTANGNAVNVNYIFRDENNVTNGNILYRLKMIDLDGTFKYSSVIMLSKKCNNDEVTIFPNPASSVINIKRYNQQNADAMVYTADGKLVLQYKITGIQNNINVKSLPNGVYVLYLQDANGNKTKKKLIIQH